MKYKKKELFHFFFSYQKKYLHIGIGTALLLLMNVLLQLPMPLVTRYLIDHIIPSKNFKALNILCIVLLVIIVLRLTGNYFMQYLIAKYKTKVRYDMERDLYLHIQELPLCFFTRRKSGYILSRISEVSSAESIMADTFIFILRDIITILVGAVLILKLHFHLGIVSLLLLPFFIYSIKVFHKKIKSINKKLIEENAQYTGKLEKNIDAVEKIKSGVKEEVEGKRISVKLFSVIGLRFKSDLVSALASTVSAFIGTIAPFIILWYGVAEIIRGNLTLGTFFAINSFLAYLYNPARELTNTGFNISRAMAGLERILELFKEEPELPGGEPIPTIDSIEFRDVEFSYNEEDRILKNFNLKINKGEKVAVVGESGEGKSTMVKMILKFYAPTQGEIYLSGMNLRDIETKSLRKKIAYISQRQTILEEDLEEKVKDETVLKLLKKIKFYKSIGEINNELQQKEFSGGEIQKIEIVESLVKDADMLIIDEGTSNIDFNAERIVLDELLKKYKDKIVIFIAHRLTSITGFERIIAINNGSIAEDGDHESLFKKKGYYSSLWGKQKQELQRTDAPG
jgi:ABC-type bacteriocin/lantibiotic exporter with double-glycine peptidase domain